MGPIMADLAGTELTDLDRALLDCSSLGGLILFTRNFDNVSQLIQLIESVRARRPELLLAVDHEGGRVQRFHGEFTRLPSPGHLLRHADGALSQAAEWAAEMGWLMAAELRAVDIDFSFAPVMDLDICSDVIGLRAFSADPDAVTSLAQAYIEGMAEAGMASVGKHFPGHGSVKADSHFEAPVDPRPLAQLEALDLVPFRALSGQLDGVMPGHVSYPEIDSQPAGYSRIWLQQILRESMAFDGVIFSDDLGMTGAATAGDLAQRAQQALAAGCDIALICNQGAEALKVAQSMSAWSSVPESVQGLAGRPALTGRELRDLPRWRQAVELAEVLSQPC
ncbi:beta-N-acetylhexosaminidase [Ferrimonas marina]|uniref:Beta-hexosaminidase n=1 Tax=Ferrimonas marina TaxID=299255 RepID=A0A1M5YQL8_9GAMM|nr:beta-N-acetylhexosaminidase [Ferrimonas marina]SHI14261.1 beta-N-acetylhexosaminidase [Ferrimonas marina]